MADNQTTLYDHWIERLRAGDQSARDEMLNHATERLQRLVGKMLYDYPGIRRWEQTDDVVQNAALRLWRSLETVTPESPRHFFHLAATQIRRELIDLSRRYAGPHGPAAHHQSRSGTTSGEAQPGVETTYEPSRLACWSEIHQQVERLSQQEREVFDLLWYQELTQQQAAALLGVSERTVKRRWQSARLSLHAALEGELPL